MIKCISFDFDRTIAHVSPLTHHFVPQLLAQKGIDVSIEQFKKQCIYLRRNLPDHLKERFSRYGTLTKEEREQFLKEYNRARVDMIDLNGSEEELDELRNWLVEQIYLTQKKILYDDVVETITKLKQLGMKLFIMSGNNSDGITEILQDVGILDSFDGIISVDKYNPHKIDNYPILIEQSQLKPEEILHVGDDVITDGFAPAKLNINVIIIRRENQMVFFEAPEHEFIIIKNLHELFNHL